MYRTYRSAYTTPVFSSPTSSPSLCVDSSPPSSPSSEHILLDQLCEDEVPGGGRVKDPLAGSFKETKTPPQYERRMKRRGRMMTPPSTPQKRARHIENMGDEEHHFHGSMPLPLYVQPSPMREKSSAEKEVEEWDKLDEEIFSQQMRIVDVSLPEYLVLCMPLSHPRDRQFTFIPEHIIQTLKCLVCLPTPDDSMGLEMTRMKAEHRPFMRSQTAPASTMGFSRTFGERTRSHVNVTAMHGMKDGIHLILSNNLITRLPRSLWDLERLTVLTLRRNYLTYLPPEICRLRNLEHLNVANNQLQYVPAELLSMNLRVLNLHPNPFIEPPTNNDHDGRPVSETQTLIRDRVLPLTELLYRILVSPAPSTLFSKGSSDSFLASYYELPLPPTSLIPPRIAETLEACIPGSVCRSDLMAEATEEVSMGVCGNPGHEAEGRIFVRPVEQRLSWEKIIAGQNAGGMVPVMWRGCSHGCLDFLQPDVAVTEEEEAADAMLVDGEEDAVVQEIRFGGGLDFE